MIWSGLAHRVARQAQTGEWALADARQRWSMSRGYSTPTVVCLCALAFICGRFLDILPGLPEAQSGVRAPLSPS